MNAAIQSRIPAREYFALPAVSISHLKDLKRSPLHYRHYLTHSKETPAMVLGTAAHTAILEPERFAVDYVVWGRRTESGRMAPRTGKAWDAFAEEHASRIIITEDEYALAMGMRDAVRAMPAAMKYLEAGEPEVSMSWMLGGRTCKGRVDWFTPPRLVGLKTAKDCRHFTFGAASAKLGYHLQWAFYHDGYAAIRGEEPSMVEIVVESAPPHAVAVYRIPNDIIEQGRAEYEDLLRLLDECEAADEWPGPCIDEEDLTLPSWVYERQEDISDLGLEE